MSSNPGSPQIKLVNENNCSGTENACLILDNRKNIRKAKTNKNKTVLQNIPKIIFFSLSGAAGGIDYTGLVATAEIETDSDQELKDLVNFKSQ